MKQDDKILLKIDSLTSLILSFQTRQEIMESNLTKQIEKLDTKFEEKFVLVNRRLDSLDFKVETLDKKVATLDKKVVALDEKVTGLDRKMAGLDEKVAGLDEKVAALDGKVVVLDERVATLDGKVTVLDRRIATLDGKVAVLDGKVAILDEKIELVKLLIKSSQEDTIDVLSALMHNGYDMHEKRIKALEKHTKLVS